MSVKNIFFTDDNQLDFKIGDEDVSKIFCGDVLVWERGEDYGNRDRIEYVKGFASPVNGTLKNTYYESGDISDECEMATAHNLSTPSYVYLKPSRPCYIIASVFMNLSDYTNKYSDYIRQGWEYIQHTLFGTYNDVVLAVFGKKSDGGTVYANDYRNSGGGFASLTALYGADSVSVVEYGSLPINITYSYNYSQSTVRRLYGFKTAAPSDKKRLYIVSQASNTSTMPNLCTDGDTLPSLSGAPEDYTFSLTSSTKGLDSQRINIDYDEISDTGGIVWFTEYKDNPSQSFTPLIGSEQFSVIVLDINYD